MPSIPAIGEITDPTKVRIALVQGQQIVSAPATALSDALGVPSGGTAGQVLTKSSGANYDSAWADVASTGTWTPVATLAPVLKATTVLPAPRATSSSVGVEL